MENPDLAICFWWHQPQVDLFCLSLYHQCQTPNMDSGCTRSAMEGWRSWTTTSRLCSWSFTVLSIHFPPSQVIAKFKDFKCHFYADDSQLLVHLSPGNCANSFHQLKACFDDIHIWMFENKLKLNPGKTEFTVFGSMDKYKMAQRFLCQPSRFASYPTLSLIRVNCGSKGIG